MSKIRTRFAPSPTGYLHIGGLRTALYAYLFAKRNNGEFLLRIEDTDQERFVEGSVEDIIATLEWAGLDFDEGPGKPGPHAPYIQSERLSKYQEAANTLIESEHAYRCFCSKERLDQVREEQMKSKKAPMYDRKCRYLDANEIQAKLDAGETFVVRQAIPLNELVKFEDVIRGRTTFDTNTLDDHVLLKSDGFPTYHLAVVVDDRDMEITHVIRGEEWLPSTPKHLLLYRSFGWEPTVFAHLPLLLNKDRTKLSKRQNDVSTQSYVEQGYLKEALLNFIALLGWNTSDNKEIYSMNDLKKEFTLERVQKAGAIFDLDKLNWFNWQWKRIKHLEKLRELAKAIDPKVEISEPKKGHLKFNFTDESNHEKFLLQNSEILQSYIEAHLSQNLASAFKTDSLFTAKALQTVEEKILQEPEKIDEFIGFYFAENFDYNKELFLHEKMQVTFEIAKQSLETCLKKLSESDFANEEKLQQKFTEIITDLNLKNGQVLWPVRVALTNEQFSPGVFELCYALGHQKSIQRIEQALKAIEQQ